MEVEVEVASEDDAAEILGMLTGFLHQLLGNFCCCPALAFVCGALYLLRKDEISTVVARPIAPKLCLDLIWQRFFGGWVWGGFKITVSERRLFALVPLTFQPLRKARPRPAASAASAIAPMLGRHLITVTGYIHFSCFCNLLDLGSVSALRPSGRPSRMRDPTWATLCALATTSILASFRAL